MEKLVLDCIGRNFDGYVGCCLVDEGSRLAIRSKFTLLVTAHVNLSRGICPIHCKPARVSALIYDKIIFSDGV